MQGQGVTSALAATPNPVDFDGVQINTVASAVVTLSNRSSLSTPLWFTTLSGSSLFGDGPLPVSLGANRSVALPVSYAPLLTSAEPDRASFGVSLCSGCPPVVTVNLVGNGVVSQLGSPSPLNFGFVQLGNSLTQAVQVTNLGNQALELLSISFDPGPSSPAPYTVAAPLANTPTTFPLSLAAGQVAAFPLTFTPKTLNQFLGNFQLSWAFSSGPLAKVPQTLTVSLLGYGGGAKLSCAPAAVDFGPSVIAVTDTSQQVLCSNIGTDVPGFPNAGLQIDPSQVQVVQDAGVFGAALESDGGVVLASGDSIAIQLSYRPPAAESDTAVLQIGSNDIAGPARIPLAGTGQTFGSCQALAQPMALAFGEVQTGGLGQLQFAIENSSATFCEISGLALAAGSDPAFSLVGPPPAVSLLSYPGASAAQNPGGRSSSLPVTVQYAPTQSAAATGAVDFLAGDVGSTTPGRVSLTGSSAGDCLSMVPPLLDFGLVGLSASTGQACNSPVLGLTVSNSCAQPVTLLGTQLAIGLDPSPEFSLSASISLPQVLAPGGSLALGVSFSPGHPGEHIESLLLTLDGGTAPSLVTLKGLADPAGHRTDTFTVQPKKVDILWVMDVDDDVPLASALTPDLLVKFFSSLEAGHVDYQMAVTDSDDCINPRSDNGSLEPCSHCVLHQTDTPTLLTSAQGLGGAETLSNLLAEIAPGYGGHGLACGAVLINDEHLFSAVSAALAPAVREGHNNGFLRDDATLGIIAVNADNEDDYSPRPVAEYLRDWAAVKGGDPQRVIFSERQTGLGPAVHLNTGDGITSVDRVGQMVSATNGVEADSSLGSWESQLSSVFDNLATHSAFDLTARPVLRSLQSAWTASP